MRAERLDELEVLRAKYHARPHDRHDTPEYGDATVRVAYVAKLDAALPELLRDARAVSEWREADAALPALVTSEQHLKLVRRLEAAEARLRGDGSDA